MPIIKSKSTNLSNILLDHITELRHCYYAATGAPNGKTRLEYAEHLRDEAAAVQYLASQLMLKIKENIRE